MLCGILQRDLLFSLEFLVGPSHENRASHRTFLCEMVAPFMMPLKSSPSPAVAKTCILYSLCLLAHFQVWGGLFVFK